MRELAALQAGETRDETDRYEVKVYLGDIRELLALVENPRTLTEWQHTVHSLAKSKGWWDEKNEQEQEVEKQLAGIALLHVGLSKQLEALRRGVVSNSAAFRFDADFVQRQANLSPRQVSMLAKLALIHSEITEAVEAVLDGDEQVRIGENGKPEGVAIEVADAAIRCLDFCGGYELDMEAAVQLKHSYNATRSVKHGGKLA